MHEKGLSLRWVDDRTGHAYGYTSQVLGPGSPKLHLEGLYEILDAIDMTPAEFWRDVYPSMEPGVAMAREPRREPERLLDPEQMNEMVGLFREVARRAARDVLEEEGERGSRSRHAGGRG